MFHGVCESGFQAYVSCSNMCLICQIPLTLNFIPKSQESSNYLFDKLRVAGWVQGQPFKRIKKIVSNHSRPSRGTCSITHATQAGGPAAKWPASDLSMDTHAVIAYQV